MSCLPAAQGMSDVCTGVYRGTHSGGRRGLWRGRHPSKLDLRRQERERSSRKSNSWCRLSSAVVDCSIIEHSREGTSGFMY